MSLAINIAKVRRVLLADGWHDIDEGSFGCDAYEILDGNTVIAGGGKDVSSTGFTFRESSVNISGPITAVLALSYRD